MPIRKRHENEAYRAEGGDVVPREKMENMAAEYTYLLTSQLEGQRKYFEEQIERAVDKATKASQKAEEAAASASETQAKQAEAIANASEAHEKVDRLEKALAKSEAAKARFDQLVSSYVLSKSILRICTNAHLLGSRHGFEISEREVYE